MLRCGYVPVAESMIAPVLPREWLFCAFNQLAEGESGNRGILFYLSALFISFVQHQCYARVAPRHPIRGFFFFPPYSPPPSELRVNCKCVGISKQRDGATGSGSLAVAGGQGRGTTVQGLPNHLALICHPPPTESELANRSYDFGMLRKSPQERQAWASHFTIIADVSPGRDAPNLKRGIDIMNRESQVVSSLCPHDRFLVTNPSSPPILCDGQRPIKAWLAILEYGTKISSPSIPLLAAEPFLLLLLITLLSVINTARIYQGLGYSRYPGALLCE